LLRRPAFDELGKGFVGRNGFEVAAPVRNEWVVIEKDKVFDFLLFDPVALAGKLFMLLDFTWIDVRVVLRSVDIVLAVDLRATGFLLFVNQLAACLPPEGLFTVHKKEMLFSWVINIFCNLIESYLYLVQSFAI
jgi:hypothetical protein